MNKITYSTLIAAAALFATGCSQDDLLVNGEGTSTFTITLPAEIGSRSFADGLSADKLEYAVYDAEGSNRLIQTGDVAFDNNSLTTTVSLALANGKNYQIAFFAHNSSATGVYNFDAAAKSVSVDYTKMTDYNTTDYDCFYSSYTTGVVTGAISQSITLTRPMAQVNWGTSDLAVYNQMYGDAASALTSKVTFKGVYSQFDLLSGAVKGETSDIAFPLLAAPGAAETFPVEPGKYQYLSMNYLLVPSASSALVEAELTPNNGSIDMTPVTVNSMPVQANYRTNVYGPLLTSPADFQVTKEIRYSEVSYDDEWFRIAGSLAEAQALLAAGERKVVLDGSFVEVVEEPLSRAAAGAVVFTLNKSAKSQKLKINGRTYAPVAVEYAPLAAGAVEAADREFALIINGNLNYGVEFDLPAASITLEGRENENGLIPTVSTLTVTNGESAVVNGAVNVNAVTKPENGSSNVEISTTNIDEYSFVQYLEDGYTDVININHDLTIPQEVASKIAVNGKKVINIAEGKTITFGAQTRLVLEEGDDLTINGGAITNAGSTKLPSGWAKTLILATDANLTINGTTLTNDMTYHSHGSAPTFPYNSSCINYWGKCNITVKNAKLYSGEFTVCGLGRGGVNTSVVNMSDSYFESNSCKYSNDDYFFSYAMRIFGSTALLERCTVRGIHGAFSSEEGKVTLRDCNMGTRTTGMEEDAYYAVYPVNASEVTIESGDYFGAIDYTADLGLSLGNSAVVTNDNDCGWPLGKIIIKGGRYSGRAYQTGPNAVIQPADGKQWVAITGDPVFKWTVQ